MKLEPFCPESDDCKRDNCKRVYYEKDVRAWAKNWADVFEERKSCDFKDCNSLDCLLLKDLKELAGEVKK